MTPSFIIMIKINRNLPFQVMQGWGNSREVTPYRASIAAITPPIAAKLPAIVLPAPAVTTDELVELEPEPVDEGLTAVVKVTTAPLPVPVAPEPVPAAPAAVVVTEAVVAVLEPFWLDTVVWAAGAAEDDETDEDAEAWEAVLEGLLTTEPVLELLPSVIWNGKLYWKMVVLESSWSLRP